jgi:serine O-acetyltransferase
MPETQAKSEAAPASDPMPVGELLARLREDWRINQCDWTRPGFRALAVYRFGVWRRTRSPLVRKGLALPGRALSRYVRNHYGIELYPTARLGRRVAIAHQGGIVIHEYAQIGNDVVIRQSCTVGAINDDRSETAPVLEDGVQLGAGAVVVGGVRVGKGARIGPNAVVFRDVPAGSLVLAPQSRVIEGTPAADA